MNDLALGWPILGGLLIGLAAALFLLLNGRVAGITGIAAQAIGLGAGDRRPSWLFLLGLLAGTAAAMAWLRTPQIIIEASTPLLIVGGLLVGFGTGWGSGCTSGHGICGLARFSTRSLVATLTFMATAALTVFVLRHLLAGRP